MYDTLTNLESLGKELAKKFNGKRNQWQRLNPSQHL